MELTGRKTLEVTFESGMIAGTTIWSRRPTGRPLDSAVARQLPEDGYRKLPQMCLHGASKLA
jgi:hypothetical protein